MVEFLWKICQGMVGGYDIAFTSVYGRRGRLCVPNQVLPGAPANVRRAREFSLGVKGARIFNLLPSYIRNINSESIDTFNSALDKFLSEIPDQPTVGGRARAADTNSLLHQIPMLNNLFG